MSRQYRSLSQEGFTLLEVLVSLVILVFGLLGLIGMQAYTQVATFEAYQRGQALILMQDMADRLSTNRGTAGCYAITTNTASGAPFAGTGTGTPVCTATVGTTATRAIANADLAAWDGALKGASEQLGGGGSVGAALDARGCISYDPATNSYRVAVAWQGMAPTVAPTAGDPAATCAKDLYGSESQRREVSTTVRLAILI
jgi:type IV pilus assembly protein PilV